MAQLQYWIWLTTRKGLTLRGQQLTLSYFGSPEAAYEASPGDIAAVPGLVDREREALAQKDLAYAREVLELCSDQGIRMITCRDERYPQRLLAIDCPPLVLYYRGTLLEFDELPVVTVVGSRNASAYGLAVARKMGNQIGACGGVVVSGAAKGIDSQALEGALEAGAYVAAVLGNGLDIVYPKSSESVYQAVANHGCLISEFAPGTPPRSRNFPQRNRIMSGLALGVLVVEAAKQSGSLITAGLALEQGRDVFAVPGNIGIPSCEGSNQLLQEGAMLVMNGWDIMREYAPRYRSRVHELEEEAPVELPQSQETELKVATPVSAPKRHKILDFPAKSAKTEKNPGPNGENRIDIEPKRNYIDLQEKISALTPDEREIAAALIPGACQVDEIVALTGLSVARVLASLTLLQVKGYVTQMPGKRFYLNIQ